MATIYCMNCGAPLDSRARYCTECGCLTRLGASQLETREMIALPDQPPAEPDRSRRREPHPRPDAPAPRVASPQVAEPPISAPVRPSTLRDVAASRRPLLIGVAAAVLALVVILGVGLASKLLGGSSPSGSEAVAPAGTSEVSDSSSIGQAGTEVRARLADYSWAELSIIGKEMTRSGSREAAIALAREYGLVDDDGRMIREYKDVEIAGIGAVPVRLVDVYHDNLANGEGKAGMTFMAANLTLAHRMKPQDDNIGGWEGSELRAWLNGEVYGALGEELRTSIVAVDKLTNNTGKTKSTSSVTSTIDRLWIPSAVEVCGPLSWTWDSDAGNSGAYNEVLNAEGFQYARFAELGIDQTEANEGLTYDRGGASAPWWMRSCSASKDAHYRIVDADGNPSRFGSAPDNLGVCFGFCL